MCTSKWLCSRPDTGGAVHAHLLCVMVLALAQHYLCPCHYWPSQETQHPLYMCMYMYVLEHIHVHSSHCDDQVCVLQMVMCVVPRPRLWAV